MSVTGTPIEFTPSSIVCTDQTTVNAQVTELYSVPILTKRRALEIRQMQKATLRFIISNYNGDPIDMRSCEDAEIKARFTEAALPSVSDEIGSIETTGVVEDAGAGIITVEVPLNIYRNAGVYWFEIGAFDEDDNMLFSNKLYLYVEPSTFATGAVLHNYPYPLPDLQEVRIRMRDSGPEENRLLDDYEFDTADICDSLVRTARYWNYAQPPINYYFNTTNYPFFLPDGYCSMLMEVAARRYLRNHLPYQAGGIAVDDQNKYKQYLEMSQLMWQNYTQFIKAKKVQINCDAAFGTINSSYWFR